MRDYFFVPQYNAHNHPIIDQPKTQLPNLTACMAGFPLPFWRATHAGANIIPTSINTHAMYLTINKISPASIILFVIKGGVYMPPPFIPGVIIYHTLRICPVLLRYESIDCISPCDLCVTLNPFLFGRHWSQQPSLRLWCLRFRHCGGK